MTLTNKSLKIGVFGTAADPPHRGHLEVVKCATHALALDKLIVIPTKIPPHKATSGVSPEMRFQMAQLQFTTTPGVEVSDIEIKRRGISYTKNTIRQLKKIYPNDKLFWIISLETLMNMPKEWRDGYAILDRCRFAVVMRGGYQLGEIPTKVLSKIIVIKNCQAPKISSTDIRLLIRRKKNVSKRVGKKVYKYIKKHKLYEK